MRITDVQAHLLAIPQRQDEVTSTRITGGFRHQIVVIVDTDAGLTGYTYSMPPF